MRLASRLVPPLHAAHPPRRLHPALRSRCAPCRRSSLYDCARKEYKLVSAWEQGRFIAMKPRSRKLTPNTENLTVKRRYLIEREVERLMDRARKHGRYGHRDATMILVAYRHGLRASEVCDLQWQQIELSEGRLHAHRVKNGIPSVHPIRGDEMRALRKLRRDYPRDAHVFVSERGGPISPIGSQMMATTRGPCSTTSGTRTFSTRSGTPTWRQTGSRTFGGTDDDGAGENSDDAWREVTSRAITCAVGACSACAPADRSRCQPPSSAGSACAMATTHGPCSTTSGS